MKSLIFLLLLCGAAPFAASGAGRIAEVQIGAHPAGEGVVLRLRLTEPVQGFGQPVVREGVVALKLYGVHTERIAEQAAALFPVQGYAVEAGPRYATLWVRLAPGAPVEAAAYRDAGGSEVLLHIAARPPAAPAPEAPALEARWNLDTVIIDAGHGGHDTGATANGVREKDVTLALAQRLGARIRRELGLAVVYTRDTDTFVSLRERGRRANAAGGKLFISIHANAAAAPAAAGTETFFLGLHKTDAAREVMERENSVVAYEAETYADMDEAALIRRTLAGSAYLKKSEALAGAVEAAFGADRHSRGVKQAGFYVLWNASMPAVLVEVGFVTNPREAAFLSSAGGQERVADAIFRSVALFQQQYQSDLQAGLP